MILVLSWLLVWIIGFSLWALYVVLRVNEANKQRQKRRFVIIVTCLTLGTVLNVYAIKHYTKKVLNHVEQFSTEIRRP